MLRDAYDLLNIVKKAAMEAFNASQPSDFVFGKVVCISPLKISVEQKLTLGVSQLVLTRNVTNFNINIGLESEEKEMTIQNALRVGDEVVLLKQKGGQKYLVLDRVVKV